ncbi:MAG: hypothetical protein ACREEA_07680 [Stellaceae bacterium]
MAEPGGFVFDLSRSFLSRSVIRCCAMSIFLAYAVMALSTGTPAMAAIDPPGEPAAVSVVTPPSAAPPVTLAADAQARTSGAAPPNAVEKQRRFLILLLMNGAGSLRPFGSLSR